MATFLVHSRRTLEDWLPELSDDPYLSITCSALKYHAINPAERRFNIEKVFYALYIIDGLEDRIEIKNFPHVVSINRFK